MFLYLLWGGFLFSTIRYDVGKDYFSYVNKITNYLDKSEPLNFGFIYPYVLDQGKMIGLSNDTIVTFFFAANAFIFFFYMSRSASLVKDSWLCVILIIFMPFFMLYSFNAVRFSSAFAVTTYVTIRYIMYGRTSFISLILALFIHNSAFIFILFYFCALSNKLTYLAILVIGIVLIGLQNYLEIFLPAFGISSSYLNTQFEINFTFYFLTAFVLAFILFQRDNEISHVKLLVLKNLAKLSASILLFSMFVSIDNSIVERFLIYLIGPMMLISPQLISEYKFKAYFQLLCIVIPLMLFYRSILDSSNNISFRLFM